MARGSEFGTSASIAGAQGRLKKMYEAPNSKRTVGETLTHLLEVLGGLVRGVRRKDDKQIELFAPKAFAWQCALATKLGVDLEDAIWAKYPRICPYCARAEDCTCIVLGKQPMQRELVQRHAASEERPETLLDWQIMLKTIYGNVNKHLGVASIGLHLLEEFAELSEVIREEHPECFGVEIADLLAWFFALVNLTIYDIDYFLRDSYNTCHRCKRLVCECAPNLKLGLRLVGR